MSQLQAFYEDVYDFEEGSQAARETLSFTHVDDRSILDDPRLHVNLAFYEAWRAAFGMYPSRIDFQDFARRQGPNAPIECLMSCAPIRLPSCQTHAKRFIDTFRSTTATLGADVTRKETKRMLLQKIGDRFCGSLDAARSGIKRASDEDESIVKSYAAFLRWHSESSESPLVALERCEKNEKNEKYEGVLSAYERNAKAIEALGLAGGVNPISGYVSDADADTRSHRRITVTEALRRVIMRDTMLFRQDMGGALLASSCLEKPDWDAPWTSARIRTADVGRLPVAILRACVPPCLYARIGFLSCCAQDCEHSIRLLSPATEGEVVVFEVQSGSADQDHRTVVRRSGIVYELPLPGQRAANRSGPGLFLESLFFNDSIATHLCRRAPSMLAGQADGDAVLLMHSFLAGYARKRRLLSRTFDVPPPGTVGKNVVLLLDTRPNVMSALSLLVTLDNLDPMGCGWCAMVKTSQRAAPFYKDVLRPLVPNLIVTVDAQLEGSSDAFDIEAYSEYMKSDGLWSCLKDMGFGHALLVQDDGMIVRRGIDLPGSNFMSQAYVGAPWLDAPFNDQVKHETGGVLVGNGGLSLRNVNAMLRITRDTAMVSRKQRLFNARLMRVPEDVFFSSGVARLGLGSCPTAVAQAFAWEQQPLDPEGPLPLGFHKPWMYNPPSAVARYFERVLMDLPPGPHFDAQ